LVDRGDEHADGCGVERYGRLIEQPQRSLNDHKARQSKAAPLAGGEVTGRDGLEATQPEAVECSREPDSHRPRSGEIAAPESQVFGDGQVRLGPIEVADEMQMLACT